MSAQIIITDINDQALNYWDIGLTEPGNTYSIGTIRIKNIGDNTPDFAKLSAALLTWRYTGGINSQGQEMIDETWLQARISASVFLPIGGDPSMSNVLTLPALSAGSSIDVDLRISVPSSANSGGAIGVIPFIDYGTV